MTAAAAARVTLATDLGEHEHHLLLGVTLAQTATRAEAERHVGELVTQALLGVGTQPALGLEDVGLGDELRAT